MKTLTARRCVRRQTRVSGRRGFSLLEMMLVVLIMGILMGVVVISFGGSQNKANVAATKAKMTQIKTALQGYAGSNGSFPPSEMGLTPLTVGLTKELEVLPKDGWGNAFVYVFPSTSGNPERPFDLKSNGPDKLPNTQDDIDVWTMNNQ